MFWVFVGIILFGIAGSASWLAGRFLPPEHDGTPLIKWGQIICAVLGVWAIASTSYINVADNKIAVLKKVYGWSSLDGEQILAVNGEKGIQAQIVPPGFHVWPLVNVIYNVEYHDNVVIDSGDYGFLTALDGAPLRQDQFLADQFAPGDEIKMLDAAHFLSNKGQRGPQSSVLMPGTWRLNPYLFKVEKHKATDIPIGFVGVVKSNFTGAVNFGNLESTKPDNCVEKTVSTNTKGEAVTTTAAAVDPGKLTAFLVPIGCIGVWDKPLQPGRYYVNEHAYTVTLISTRVQTWEFKGGYRKRYIDLSVDQAGNLTQKERAEEVASPPDAADRAVIPRVEGWEVPQELRVLAQVTPDNAPFVVASVGGIKEVEDNIMVPTIRSIVRNILGSEERKVLDLMDNRSNMEKLVEEAIRPEGLRAGIVIKEVKFGDPALPPELLVSRLRQQLAGQLKETYKQEQIAQEMRITAEKSKATAEQQPELVRAQIGVQTAEQNAKAAELRGKGLRAELEQIAEGQKAQARVLGEDKVLIITLTEKVLATLKDKPELVSLIGRLVPVVSVTDGGGHGLTGAASAFGAIMGVGRDAAAATVGAPKK
jgi:regulator of protease activity HflC (stomatin/prohibitin superfamily)